MLINKSNSRLDINIYINIYNHKIEQVFQIKCLGIMIYCKLSRSEHVKNLEINTTSCGLISKIRHHVDQISIRKSYYKHVYSHLQYASLAMEERK